MTAATARVPADRVIPHDPVRALGRLYAERASIDQRIVDLERVVDRIEAGRARRTSNVQCGTDGGYYRHRRLGQPFPEDVGKKPCGCRRAHARAEARRAQTRAIGA